MLEEAGRQAGGENWCSRLWEAGACGNSAYGRNVALRHCTAVGDLWAT